VFLRGYFSEAIDSRKVHNYLHGLKIFIYFRGGRGYLKTGNREQGIESARPQVIVHSFIVRRLKVIICKDQIKGCEFSDPKCGTWGT